MDGFDDLQADVDTKSRKQRSRREEATPAPRKPKPAQPAGSGPQQDDTQADAPAHAHTGVPVHEQTGTPAPSKAPTEPEPAKHTRPPSVEAYLTEDLMDWMWKVRAAGMRQRRDNVTSAVVRLALEQMRERMSPKEIITALEEAAPSPEQGKNRRGRRR